MDPEKILRIGGWEAVLVVFGALVAVLVFRRISQGGIDNLLARGSGGEPAESVRALIHDLRGPIHTLKYCVDQMKKDSSQDCRRYLTQIERSLAKVNRLMEDAYDREKGFRAKGLEDHLRQVGGRKSDAS